MLTHHGNALPKIQAQSWIDSRLQVRASPIHGRGLFATAPVQKGEVVIVWGGTIFTLRDIQAGKAAEHSYTALRRGIFLGHSVEQGNSADDYMNHSCDPNIWMTDEITWVARRDIRKDDEVTADFAMYWGPDGDGWAEWACHCGSKLCRKAFTTRDWERVDLQERYGNYFAPYINACIRRLHDAKNRGRQKQLALNKQFNLT